MKTVNKVFEYKDEKFNIAISIYTETSTSNRYFKIKVTGITFEFLTYMDSYESELESRLLSIENYLKEVVDNHKNKNQDILTKLEKLGFN